jgi:hypothetical protein
MYVSPLSSVVSAHETTHHHYVDHIQLYAALQPVSHTDLFHIVQCVADVSRWLLENRLPPNPAKTEVVVFGTIQRLRQLHCVIDVAGASVQFTEAVRLLRVTLDATLSLA